MSTKHARKHTEPQLGFLGLEDLVDEDPARGGRGGNKAMSAEFMRYLITQGAKDGLASMGIDALDPAGIDVLEAAGIGYDHLGEQPQYIRSFCSAVPIPFSAFDGIRSSSHTVDLTEAQEVNVLRSLAKIIAPQSTEDPQDSGNTFFTALYPRRSQAVTEDISVPLPFVSAFFDQRCPDLRTGMLSNSRAGATYLILAIITGDVELCQHCLEFGANPNSMVFLHDEDPPPGEMSHGYSPVFMAVLAEQLAVLDTLSQFGGSIHVYDRWGRTPLHAAVAMNSVEVVQWLLAKGAPRYVGDCLNLIPAESADDDYFPDLAMPNAALYGPPPPPPLAVLKAQVQAQHLLPAEDKQSAGGSGSATTTPTAEGATDVPATQLCHCLSGRPAGFCGCVDDMYARWSLDRLRTDWSPGVDFLDLFKKQSTEDRSRMVLTAASRRRK